MKDFTNLEPIDYLRIPWRRRWYALTATIVVAAGVSVFAWLKHDFYRSETRILVESASLLDDPLSPAASRDRTEERVNAIRQLLESRSILLRIIEEFRLRAADSGVTEEDALKNIRNNLEVSKASGGTFTMAYYHTDPQSAQAIARRLTEIFISYNQSAQKEKAVDKGQFLDKELEQANKELADSDTKIKEFKVRNVDELPEQSVANMNALSSLQSQLLAIDSALDRARDQQKMLEFRVQEQQRLNALAKALPPKEKPEKQEAKPKPPPSPLAAQLVAKQAQLAEMTARYTARHPDVMRLSKEVEELEQQVKSENAAQVEAAPGLTPLSPPDARQAADAPKEQTTTPAELSAETDTAQARYELEVINRTIVRREKDRELILNSMKVYQGRLRLAPSLEQELLGLTRDYESKRQQVANLQTRKFNAQMAANAVTDRKSEVYKTLDEASLPERPVFPARLHILLMGIGASLIAGIAAAFTREYFEPSLANEEEAAAVLKVPVLVSVPEIPGGPKALTS